MRLIDSQVARALNHLLGAEPWARARLAPFSAAVCELRAAPFAALRFRIAEDGTLAPAEEDGPASLVLTLGPQALPALARGEDHFMRAVEVSGNAQLASEVLFLVRHLRWDVEEDLSAWVGDALAHGLVRTAREFAALSREAAGRVAGGVMEYAVEERQLLVRRAELSGFGSEIAVLRDAVDRLELRLERLSRR
ncbi:MAG: hypothetical protein A3I63_00525 [Betaproteobacteria bacterium RIFCSPLOWO2_02_FULL_66_14]|nr:MAG: hypothetical protein A3I63_00525 [Betaproteobacteria bacterium RIFCSPLOWO2_02_FULL_66_14]